MVSIPYSYLTCNYTSRVCFFRNRRLIVAVVWHNTDQRKREYYVNIPIGHGIMGTLTACRGMFL